MRFDIEPGVGALPIQFGAQPGEVHKAIGHPDRRDERWGLSGVSEYFLESSVNVGYDASGLVDHVGFVPGAFTLTYRGRRIWSPGDRSDPNPVLLEYEPEPRENLGFLVFDSLCVTTAGYHDDDPSQYSLTTYPKGAWADALSEATDPDLSRYGRTR